MTGRSTDSPDFDHRLHSGSRFLVRRDAGRGLAREGADDGFLISSPLTVAAGPISGPLALSTSSDNPPNPTLCRPWKRRAGIPRRRYVGDLDLSQPDDRLAPGPPELHLWARTGSGSPSPITIKSLRMTSLRSLHRRRSRGPAPPANLLLLTFSASADASGLFGIYARLCDESNGPMPT